jgi:hypothetical protein
MSHRWPFTLEGQFLGFVTDEVGKLKYLNLSLPANESITIKLPKTARSSLRLMLEPGDTVQIKGSGKLDLQTGALKLKADQILPLSFSKPSTCPMEAGNLPDALPSTPSPSKKAKAKILVCRKSGCLKRGGHELRESLEKALCDRNWQDHVELEWTGCLKRCSKAPNFMVMPGKACHNRVHPTVLTQLDALIAKKCGGPQ